MKDINIKQLKVHSEAVYYHGRRCCGSNEVTRITNHDVVVDRGASGCKRPVITLKTVGRLATVVRGKWVEEWRKCAVSCVGRLVCKPVLLLSLNFSDGN